MHKNLRLVKPGEPSEPAPKDAHRPEPVGEDMLWMTASIDDKSTEYTWTPSDPPEPAVRPKLRRRK